MTFVVDASVAIKWFLPELYGDAALRLLREGHSLVAPDLLFPEVGNVLWKRVRRREATAKEAGAALDALVDAAKITTDTKKRDAQLREGLEITRDQAYYVPLHHQMRPWAMKKNVSIVYSPDDRPQARFATVK